MPRLLWARQCSTDARVELARVFALPEGSQTLGPARGGECGAPRIEFPSLAVTRALPQQCVAEPLAAMIPEGDRTETGIPSNLWRAVLHARSDAAAKRPSEASRIGVTAGATFAGSMPQALS